MSSHPCRRRNIYFTSRHSMRDKLLENKLTIRNSTAELFDVDVRTVSEHLQNIYANGELQEDSVIRKFRITQNDTI